MKNSARKKSAPGFELTNFVGNASLRILIFIGLWEEHGDEWGREKPGRHSRPGPVSVPASRERHIIGAKVWDCLPLRRHPSRSEEVSSR